VLDFGRAWKIDDVELHQPARSQRDSLHLTMLARRYANLREQDVNGAASAGAF
jgi:hypothetical protein